MTNSFLQFFFFCRETLVFLRRFLLSLNTYISIGISLDEDLIPKVKTFLSNKNEFFIELTREALEKLFSEEIIFNCKQFIQKKHVNTNTFQLDPTTTISPIQIYDKLGFAIKNNEKNIQISFLATTYERLILHDQLLESHQRELQDTLSAAKIAIFKCKSLFEENFYTCESDENIVNNILQSFKNSHTNPLEIELIILCHKKFIHKIHEDKRKELANTDV